MNHQFRTPRCARLGFTLVEMLVAVAVLGLLIVLLGQLLNMAINSTTNSGGRMEANSEARIALDRIGADFASMVDRQDLNYELNKIDGNDSFYFFSSVPGALPSGAVGEPSGLTLVGYRIKDNHLERLAIAMTNDALKFLTYAADGSVVAKTGIKEAISAATDADYQVLCDGVFRLEFGFILKDGTFAIQPLDEKRKPAGSEQGTRRWNATENFAEVCVIANNTPTTAAKSRTVYRPLGSQDVAAVVVSLAVIDSKSAVPIDPTSLASAAENFADATPSADATTLPAKGWLQQVNSPESLGIQPPSAQGAVRVYERIFDLNTL